MDKAILKERIKNHAIVNGWTSGSCRPYLEGCVMFNAPVFQEVIAELDAEKNAVTISTRNEALAALQKIDILSDRAVRASGADLVAIEDEIEALGTALAAWSCLEAVK